MGCETVGRVPDDHRDGRIRCVELYGVIRSNSSPKTVTLTLNIAIVVYLAVQVRRRGHG